VADGAPIMYVPVQVGHFQPRDDHAVLRPMDADEEWSTRTSDILIKRGRGERRDALHALAPRTLTETAADR
jgi:hypothetical protein